MTKKRKSILKENQLKKHIHHVQLFLYAGPLRQKAYIDKVA